MAVDYFLKLEGIKGESQDDKHKDEIDILSFSWGATQSAAALGGGGGAGKVQMQDFNFSSRISRASARLILGVATGEHIASGILTARKAGGGGQEFLKITLSDILITSYQTSGSSGGDMPTESFSLNYGAIEYVYKEQKADGTLGAPSTVAWDVRANKKIGD